MSVAAKDARGRGPVCWRGNVLGTRGNLLPRPGLVNDFRLIAPSWPASYVCCIYVYLLPINFADSGTSFH